MRRLSLLALVLCATVSLGAAANITPSSVQPTVQPGETETYATSVDIGNYTEVTISSTSDRLTFNNTYLDSNGTIMTTVAVEDSVSTGVTIGADVVYDFVNDTGNYTNETTLTQDVLIDVREEYQRIHGGLINETAQYQTSIGTNVSFSSITSDDLTITVNGDDTTMAVDETQLFTTTDEKLNVTVEATYPVYDTADVTIRSNRADTFEFFPNNTNDSNDDTEEDTGSECKLGIRTLPGFSLRRGQMFEFNSIDENTGENAPNVRVMLRDGGVEEDDLIGEAETSRFDGYGRIWISEDVVGPVSARLVPLNEDSECNPRTMTVRFDRPYNNYIAENEAFHLEMSGLQEQYDLGDHAVMTIRNEEGDVVDGVQVRVEPDNGVPRTIDVDGSGVANYTVEHGGNHTVSVLKDNYQTPSDRYFMVEPDTDGDGILDKNDACPETPADTSDGCPLQDMSLDVTYVGNDTVDPGTEEVDYVASLINENGTVVEVNDTIEYTVDGVTRNQPLYNGETSTMQLDPDSEYSFSFDADGYTASSTTVSTRSVETESGGSGAVAAMVGGGVVLLIGGILIIGLIVVVSRWSGNNGGSGGPATSHRPPGTSPMSDGPSPNDVEGRGGSNV